MFCKLKRVYYEIDEFFKLKFKRVYYEIDEFSFDIYF